MIDITKGNGLLKTIFYALTPLFILLFFAALSAILSYIILMLTGDIVSMRKLVSRATQIFLLLSIFPLRHYLKLTWSNIGFSSRAVFFKQLLYGFVLGKKTLTPITLSLYLLDINIIDHSRDWTFGKVLIRISLALLVALLVSLGEEPLFSGILFAGLRNKMVLGLAALLSSCYYATFHFVKTKTDLAYDELTIGSGFQLMREAFTNLLNPEITSAFIALFVVGLFLVTIRAQFKESIGICIGCHAAWVWQIKIATDFFDINKQAVHYDYLVNSYYNSIIGPLVSVWLLLFIAGFFIWKKYRM